MKKILLYIFLVALLFNSSFQLLGITFLSSLDELFVLFCFGYMIVQNRFSFTKSSFKLLGIIFVFFAAGIVSFFINSYDNDLTNYAFIGGALVIKFPLLIFSIMNIKIKGEEIRNFVNAIINIAKFTSPFVIVSFLFPTIYKAFFPFVMYETPRLGFHGAMGLFYFPGLSGWFNFFVACIFLSMHQYTHTRKAFLYFLYFSGLALLSLKVKVIISVIAILSIWLLFFNSKFKLLKIFFGSITGSAIYMAFSSVISTNINMYFVGGQSLQDDTARLALLNTSYKIAQDYFPLGVGFSKFGSEFAKRNYSEYYYEYGLSNIYGLRVIDNAGFATDTYWPQVIGEVGIFGLFLIIIQYLYILKNLVHRLLSNKILAVKKVFVLSSLLIMIQALLESSAGAVFYTSPHFVLVGILVGYALSNNVYENN